MAKRTDTHSCIGRTDKPELMPECTISELAKDDHRHLVWQHRPDGIRCQCFQDGEVLRFISQNGSFSFPSANVQIGDAVLETYFVSNNRIFVTDLVSPTSIFHRHLSLNQMGLPEQFMVVPFRRLSESSFEVMDPPVLVKDSNISYSRTSYAVLKDIYAKQFTVFNSELEDSSVTLYMITDQGVPFSINVPTEQAPVTGDKVTVIYPFAIDSKPVMAKLLSQ